MDDNGYGMDTIGDRDAARAEDAALVDAARQGDPDAFGALYERWFTRVHDLAFRITRDPQAAGDVVQDAFLAAWRGLADLQDPAAFGGWLLRITRNRAFNEGRTTARTQPVDAETMTMIERAQAEDRVEELDQPAQLAADTELVALVWESVDALGARDAEVLDLSLRHGLTPAEVAEVVGTNRNAANQMVHRARLRLGDAIRARVLWRGGEPQCGDLADALRAAGITRFDADAVRVTTAHAESCERCEERRRLRLDPAVLFAAVPMIGAPTLLRQKIAHALSAEGVPMGRAAQPRAEQSGGRRRRVRRVVASAAVAIAVVVVGVVLAAEGIDDDPAPTARLEDVRVTTTSTTTPPSTTTPRATSPAAAPTSEPAIVAPPITVAPPTPPTTAAPTVQVSITVSPASAPMAYLRPSAPVLTWSTTGPATSVEVSGPGFASSDAAGSSPVCPTASVPSWSFCTGPAGSSTYTVVARGAGGEVLASWSAMLTIA